jgi:hypothetical protein
MATSPASFLVNGSPLPPLDARTVNLGQGSIIQGFLRQDPSNSNQ